MPATIAAPTATSTVAQRVAALRELAKTDPLAAQDAAWSWMQRVGRQLPDPAAAAELAELFAAGDPADVDGQTYGVLLGFLDKPEGINRGGELIHTLARAFVSRFGVPWLGKKFNKSASHGTNTMPRLAAVAVPLLTRYRLRAAGGNWEGFDMLNRVEDSVVTPGTAVLVLDYETEHLANPWPVNQIRDEATQIVPGTYIGAKIWHQEDGYHQLAWWACKIDV